MASENISFIQPYMLKPGTDSSEEEEEWVNFMCLYNIGHIKETHIDWIGYIIVTV